MSDFLVKPSCDSLDFALFLGQLPNIAGFGDALQNSGVFPEKYLNALSDASFYCHIRNYILHDNLINGWMWFVVNNLSTIVLAMSTAFITLWVVMAGLKIMYRSNKEPVLDMMFRGAKIALVLSLVSGMLGKTDTIIHTVLGLQDSITTIVTGSDLPVDQLIDMNLAVAQVMKMVTDDVVDASADKANKTGGENSLLGVMGQAGPAMLTSILVLLSQIAIVIALMLAPLFIFFLLFQQTTPLFWGWAKFLLGTFIALCFVGIVSSIAMNATLSYGMVIMVSYVLNALADAAEAAGSGLGTFILGGLISLLTDGGNRVDMSGAAMRMAMMGGLFSTLIVAVPPLVMQLFSASLGFAQNVMGSMGVRPLAMQGAGGMAGGGMGGGSGAGGGMAGGALGSAGVSGALPAPTGAAVPLSAAAKALGGAFGFSAPAGGSAQSNNQTLINRANASASGGTLSETGAPGSQRPGSLGLAARDDGSLRQLQALQAGDEFREGSRLPPSPVVATAVAAGGSGMKWHANGTNVSDAVIRNDPVLGSGGHLPVSGQPLPEASVGAARPPAPLGHSAQPAGGGARPGVPTPHQDRARAGRP
jgi:type IV secretion system protein VirB6